MTVAWLKPAIADLEDALGYIRTANPDAAQRTGAKILAAVALVERNPEIGRLGRVAGTRELVVAGTPFVIPYRLRNGRLELLRVLHGRRRFP